MKNGSGKLVSVESGGEGLSGMGYPPQIIICCVEVVRCRINYLLTLILSFWIGGMIMHATSTEADVLHPTVEMSGCFECSSPVKPHEGLRA